MADTLNSKLNPRHVPLASQKHLGESCPSQVVNASDSIHECEVAPGASNAVWAGPVSALRWVPLSAYAADGRPATCSKGHAVQWDWEIVRWGRGDFIRTRYRRRRFLNSLQEIWRTGDIHWPMNEDARIHHCLYANMLRNHKTRLTVL